jgi:nucleoside-diphosphate-sugar epimerase
LSTTFDKGEEKMKILVTGATGFLGSALTSRLIAEGHSVTALMRSESGRAALEKKGLRTLVGSLLDTSSWEQNLQGMEAIVHCAAPVEFWGVWEDFRRDIVETSVALLRAANRMQVKRFVYISSESVLQDVKPLLDIDEAEPYPETPNSLYGRAKKEAEIALLSEPAGAVRVILRPTFIWGPGVKALETMAGKVRSGDFMWVDQGRSIMEMVHVDNVVEAIMLSLVKGADKSIYYVTDNNPLPVREFLGKLLATTGVEPPKKNINGKIASMAARITETLWKVFGVRSAPPLSRFELAFVSQPRRYKLDRIRKDLGYVPIRSLEDGLKTLRG